MPTSHVEEARNVGDEFPPLIAFPRQSAVQPELSAQAYGAHGAHVSHAIFSRCDGRP
jgi:hypothetical protein